MESPHSLTCMDSTYSKGHFANRNFSFCGNINLNNFWEIFQVVNLVYGTELSRF